MNKQIGFVITAVTAESEKDDKPTVKYFTVGSDGYSFWSNFFGDSKFFKNIKDTEKVLETDEFTKEVVYPGGEIFPPRMIHSGANLNTEKSEGTVIITICAVELSAQIQKTFYGKIKRPIKSKTVYSYK